MTLVELSTRVGDELVAALEEHEREDHAGEHCMGEHVNVLAYIAHRIGFDHNDLTAFALWIGRLDQYGREHDAGKGARLGT